MTITYDLDDFRTAWDELCLGSKPDLLNEARGLWEQAGRPEPKRFLLRWLNG